MPRHINIDIPIKFKSLEDIINIIHNRYPLLSKYQIVFIVKSFFEEIRSSLTDGYSISMNNFVDNIELLFYNRNWNDKKVINVKAKLKTPKRFKLD